MGLTEAEAQPSLHPKRGTSSCFYAASKTRHLPVPMLSYKPGFRNRNEVSSTDAAQQSSKPSHHPKLCCAIIEHNSASSEIAAHLKKPIYAHLPSVNQNIDSCWEQLKDTLGIDPVDFLAVACKACALPLCCRHYYHSCISAHYYELVGVDTQSTFEKFLFPPIQPASETRRFQCRLSLQEYLFAVPPTRIEILGDQGNSREIEPQLKARPAS